MDTTEQLTHARSHLSRNTLMGALQLAKSVMGHCPLLVTAPPGEHQEGSG